MICRSVLGLFHPRRLGPDATATQGVSDSLQSRLARLRNRLVRRAHRTAVPGLKYATFGDGIGLLHFVTTMMALHGRGPCSVWFGHYQLSAPPVWFSPVPEEVLERQRSVRTRPRKALIFPTLFATAGSLIGDPRKPLSSVALKAS